MSNSGSRTGFGVRHQCLHVDQQGHRCGLDRGHPGPHQPIQPKSGTMTASAPTTFDGTAGTDADRSNHA